MVNETLDPQKRLIGNTAADSSSPYNRAVKWRALEESAQSTDTRALREIFAERKTLIERYVPEETRAINARVVAELKEKQVGSLAVGAKAPNFELKDQNGKAISSTHLLSQGRLVVCFIRGRWCPFCVGQTEAMNLMVPQIKETGASLVAISPQTVQQSFFMSDQHKLHFPLLSDAGNKVAREFGLSYPVPYYQQSLYKRVFINLPLANGDESWQLPIPATYILDRDGTIVFASGNADYTDRPEPGEVLQKLATLAK